MLHHYYSHYASLRTSSIHVKNNPMYLGRYVAYNYVSLAPGLIYRVAFLDLSIAVLPPSSELTTCLKITLFSAAPYCRLPTDPYFTTKHRKNLGHHPSSHQGSHSPPAREGSDRKPGGPRVIPIKFLKRHACRPLPPLGIFHLPDNIRIR
jgi:hypothetical protein